MPAIPPSIGRSRSKLTRSPESRESAAKRGYSYRWQKYAKSYLAQHPLCIHCEQAGRTTLASLVDHITPVLHGETDPNFWPATNHQPLCRRCHARKTTKDIQLGLTR